jgi:hypothetical protein
LDVVKRVKLEIHPNQSGLQPITKMVEEKAGSAGVLDAALGSKNERFFSSNESANIPAGA